MSSHICLEIRDKEERCSVLIIVLKYVQDLSTFKSEPLYENWTRLVGHFVKLDAQICPSLYINLRLFQRYKDIHPDEIRFSSIAGIIFSVPVIKEIH
mgnify:CR=1 FL=1